MKVTPGDRRPLELWGGVECTVNRVRKRFYDQLSRSGHRLRVREDLARFHDLGLRKLRTALHWERFAQTGSWNEFDRVTAALRELGIEPIVGLVHHGSGPRTTSLLDAEFPTGLAAYGRMVAERYPDVLEYTPVNEPQTTGRFACLYGWWYPHEKHMTLYLRALLNQVKATVLTMRAIREVQPLARLISTEDGGVTYSTPELESYRVEREHRRWLGVDLLCGRVTRDHALFPFLTAHGLSQDEVLWFADNPCPPAVIGLNYYVTSDRMLDHRLSLYPPRSGGDTGSEPLVDMEAVRVRAAGIAGAGTILRQAWERYRIPVAITEAHLGSEPIEQVRWLTQIWREAEEARAAGVDVVAVTVWALLGSYNWCHICTRDTNAYEPGVFDLSSGTPQPTRLAEAVRQLAHGTAIDGPAAGAGWWARMDRLTIEPA